MNKKYSIGIDFGTKSGRAVLVDVDNGKELATSVYKYPNGVIDEYLPLENESIKLSTDWALQDPNDYLEVIYTTVPEVIQKAAISPESIIGLGIDFTACTMLPIDKSGEPLCNDKKFRNRPNAWVKLWKHHAAQPYANKLNEVAKQRGEDFLERYGGKISSEWMFPKIWQTLDQAPDIYKATDRFIEATDWVIMKLTGQEKRNISTTGYKAIWSKDNGYPDKDFFKSLDPRLENVVKEKLTTDIYALGEKAGNLKEELAKKINLRPDVAVAVANVDSFVSVPAVTVSKPGKMVMVMGTSICHMVIDEKEKFVPGMTGVIKDGILLGYYGYEAGQSAVGDIFEWYIREGIPSYFKKEAKDDNKNVYDYLEEKAAKLRPGESGLLALDWWNGNRSVLVDADLTGMILGLHLNSKPGEIYRALIEATAYGTNMIIKTFEENGINIDELYACGGLAKKNETLMQIYADVTNKPIKIAASQQTPALGAAMHGAVAAGSKNGGYNDINEAIKNMAHLMAKEYHPILENVEIYRDLYSEYEKLYDYFGRGENNVMKRLKKIKQNYE
ncbi:MAG: ribulokinase [Halanaerobiales bacterium]|nr:ribulokinase [Halanaerobiales bacterium]